MDKVEAFSHICICLPTESPARVVYFILFFLFLCLFWVASNEMKSVNTSECLFGVLSTMIKFIDACRKVEG